MLRVVLSVFFCLLRLASAVEVSCTVSQDGGWTRYSVQEFTADQCHYWWRNSSKHVLATHVDPAEDPVVTKSGVALTTNQCLEVVHYLRDCISEGSPQEATCVTNCSRDPGHLQSWIESRHYYWIVAVAVGLLLVGFILCIVSSRNPGVQA